MNWFLTNLAGRAARKASTWVAGRVTRSTWYTSRFGQVADGRAEQVGKAVGEGTKLVIKAKRQSDALDKLDRAGGAQPSTEDKKTTTATTSTDEGKTTTATTTTGSQKKAEAPQRPGVDPQERRERRNWILLAAVLITPILVCLGFIGRFLYANWQEAQAQADARISPKTVTAGTVETVVFVAGGDQGLDVLERGWPKSQPVDCVFGKPVANTKLESTDSAGKLTYNKATGHYTYRWKTARSWDGTCRQLVITLAQDVPDAAGAQLTIYFAFVHFPVK